jgi:hypothetical protein
MANKKPTYRFVAYVCELDENNQPILDTPIATHQFEAVSEIGAMRGASQWFGKRWDVFGGAGQGNWSRSDDGRLACRDACFHNWAICLRVLGPERDEILERFIGEVRQDAVAAQARYSEKFLELVAKFATYRMQQSAVTSLKGYVKFPYPDEQTIKDFDLLYDLPHVPPVLAQAMDRPKKDLDGILGSEKMIMVNCPFCSQDQKIFLLRRKNGYFYRCQHCDEIVKLHKDRVWRGQSTAPCFKQGAC